jgi:hypothetical protein
MKFHVLKMVSIFVLATAGFSLAVMLLWNALLPAIIGVAVINYWQALGLLVLARILFGGFGPGRHFGHHGHRGFDRNALREKWANMSDEERKEFMKKRHFHHHPFFGCDCKGEEKTDN